ncbi:alpha/beta fold hydrolase [Chlorobium phaeovibrioides]|nr:alpha/beta hydrolase [Chlorobium phaeovibrioides]
MIELMPGAFADPEVAQTGCGPIEYSLTGSGAPVVMVMHGGMGGYDQARVILGNWLDENEYRFLCPSRPGYLGTPLDSGRSMEEQADLFAALLDHLGIDKVAVVTVSAGGPPGYVFALRHPERVWALIAIDSVSGYYALPETTGAAEKMLFTTTFGQKLANIFEKISPASYLKELFTSTGYFTKNQLQDHIDYVLGNKDALDFVHAFMNTMYPYDKREAGTENDMSIYRTYTRLPLEGIGCPALIIHGTHDADVKFYDGVYAYESIKGAERHWIEYGSHVCFWMNRNSLLAQRRAVEFLSAHKQ